jgi:hypothetical protein
MAERRNDERQMVGEPLETEEGIHTPVQQNLGQEATEGGGEFPDPNTPPRLPAPGAADDPPEPGPPPAGRGERPVRIEEASGAGGEVPGTPQPL